MKVLLKKLGLIFITLLFMIFTLGPITWCFIVSISTEKEMFSTNVNLLPQYPTLDNYRMLLDFSSRQGEIFMRGLGNSMEAVLITLLIGMPVCLMAAYALSRFDFKLKTFIRNALLGTIVIPVFTTIIPLYDMFSKAGILDNSFWLSVVYVSSFLPMITWILSNYINTIPKSLDEAAFLDGAGPTRVFLNIILPNSYPIIFAVILMVFLLTWSQYQIPMILATSLETKPLSMIVAEFTAKDLVQYGITAAAGILALLPPTVVAVIFRKSLVLGMTQGAVNE